MAAREVELQNDRLVPRMWGRTYFGNACAEGRFDHRQYAAFKLLGRTLKYSVNLRSQGCGCNVALYLVSMRQNPAVGGCCDYYCDANSVCGVNCAEIDIQEANIYAWRSTLHVAYDGGGAGDGFGGGRSAFSADRYGPGAACIDTNAPFQVACSFPVDTEGNLTSMDVALSQNGCSVSVSAKYPDKPQMQHLKEALAQGMTPVASLWKGGMGWLDSPPCLAENASACPDTTEFFDFSVTDLAGQPINDDSDAAMEAAAAEEMLPIQGHNVPVRTRIVVALSVARGQAHDVTKRTDIGALARRNACLGSIQKMNHNFGQIGLVGRWVLEHQGCRAHLWTRASRRRAPEKEAAAQAPQAAAAAAAAAATVKVAPVKVPPATSAVPTAPMKMPPAKLPPAAVVKALPIKAPPPEALAAFKAESCVEAAKAPQMAIGSTSLKDLPPPSVLPAALHQFLQDSDNTWTCSIDQDRELSSSSSSSTTQFRYTASTTIAGGSIANASGGNTNNPEDVDLLGPQVDVGGEMGTTKVDIEEETGTTKVDTEEEVGTTRAEMPREAEDTVDNRSAREVIFAQDLV
eukprot:CAMPEP_0172933916 /NCGR_PEP_ID=MMETSP1075-20121228/220743_1 /TAXON_ID=2916 /ORGANISM="Ceratium fusus, Strain PA161109" /LENGTH=573 /DNA_ID=CAMNT_0013795263 /DNA_START=192 /DNA_END=1915 /DNA_ORIENTATION=+